MSTKSVRVFFILLRSLVICQIQKMPGFYTLTETRFINNSRSKQSKKYVEHIFVDIVKQEMYAKFQQKILVAGRRQRFQLFRQITWFLRNNRALSKFKYWILHYLISIIKLQNS